MAPILHCTDMSPPVRGVLMTARALDVDLDLREINLMEKEHLTPEYLKVGCILLHYYKFFLKY